MSTAARKRLMKDFKRLQKDPPIGILATPLDNNVMAWCCFSDLAFKLQYLNNFLNGKLLFLVLRIRHGNQFRRFNLIIKLRFK